MLAVSNSIKNAYNQYTTQRKSYIKVGNTTYQIQNMDLYADAYDEGNVIGNAIAKTLTFDIETQYVNGLDEFQLYDGIWTGEEYEYINLGTFKLFEEKGTDDFFSSVTAYDKLILFNQPYDPSLTTFPTTLYGLLQNICSQANVTLNTLQITNGSKVLDTNLFVEGETLKDILKAICQISGSFAIISNDELKLILQGTDTLTLSNYQISSPEYKRTTWKINQLILGMTDVDGEYVLRQDDDDIRVHGIHKLVINDNPFVYSQALREAYIDELFERVKSFGYVSFETEWEGLPYVELGDKVNIGNRESLVLRYEIKSPDGLDSMIAAPSIIDSVVDYIDNTEDLDTRQKKTEIKVNKAVQQIELLAEEIVPVSNKITGMGHVTLDNAYEGTLHRLEIIGNLQLLFPSNTLYPSNTLKPTSFRLQVDDNVYELDFTKLRYVDSTTYDKYVYEDGKQWVERYDGTKEESDKEILIEVTWNSTLTLINQPNARLNCEYLLDNEYTDSFTTNVDLISRINLTPGNAEIDARRISLTGKTIDLTSDTIEIKSKYFNVDKDGNMSATSATLSGSLMNYSSKNGKLAIEIRNTKLYFYDYKGSGDVVGSVSSTTSGNAKGISFYTIKPGRISIGYKDNEEDTAINNIIHFDTNNPNDTPWIKNTVSGTIFSNAGGITVQHGLIKDWNLQGTTGTFFFNTPSGTLQLTVKNGLITAWEYI